ncbi:MAG: Phenylalanine--tRNA ligase, partial [Bacteroidetes bacterium]|nr:Phenylalanine--tRNA ligase [Bacteroidota bacterium]
GTDPEGVWYALQRATQLVHEVAGGEVLKGTIDIKAKPIRLRQVELRTAKVNSLLGTSLKAKGVSDLLGSLGITPGVTRSDSTRFHVPTYRVDLEREVDLIEEVARVYGYDKIEERSTASIDFSHPFQENRFVDEVRQTLVGFGFHESISYSLQDWKTSELTGETPVRLLNPQTSDLAALRTSIVPGLLASVARNVNLGNTDLRLFEIGKVYRIDDGPLPKLVENFMEEERIGLLLSGNKSPKHWSKPADPCDIFDLKGDVFDLLHKFALDKRGFISYSTSNRLADSAVAIEINGSYAGYLGGVSEEVLKKYEIEQNVFVAEISFGPLQSAVGKRQHVPLPKYPRVKRDVAFIVSDATNSLEVEQIIVDASSSLLQSVELFDVYRGENLEKGKKSLAYSLNLMSWEKTLTDEEIDVEVKRVVEAVVRKTGGVLRAL